MLWQRYYQPGSVAEVLEILASAKGRARLVAGATDLAIQLKRGEVRVDSLVDVTRIPDLDHIRRNGSKIEIGALVTHAQAAKSELLKEEAPLLVEACSQVGSPQIRNVATIGGNIATASPAADTVPPLLVLEAQVFLASDKGERCLSLEELLLRPGRAAIANEEIITRVEFHALHPGTRSAFLKLGRRQAMAISVVNVATVLRLANDHVEEVRIALGSVAPTVVRCRQAERALLGEPFNEQSLTRTCQAAANETLPISDIRGTADYRYFVAQALLRRALLAAAEQCRGAL